MNKLVVFAAAAMFAVGAFAQCSPVTPVTAVGTNVYDVVITLKTTAGYQSTIKIDKCGSTNICYRKSGKTIKWQGYYYSCDDSCNAGTETFTSNTLELWDATYKLWLTPTIAWNFIHVISKGDALESDFELTETVRDADLRAAGFGSYDVKYGRVKSMTGYIAGSLNDPTCAPVCAAGIDTVTWVMCDVTMGSALQGEDTAAYGTWTIKYNASKSKSFGKTGALSYPSYL